MSWVGLKRYASRLLGHLDEVDIVYRVIGGTPGTMLDVGAHQGSSVIPFVEHGWTVHAFEPDPANRKILSARCPRAIIDSRAISEVDGDEVQLYTSDVSTGISTLSPFHGSHAPTVTVKTVRLDTYINQQKIKRVDFLKTDIEGFDLFALRTFPWETQHPRAIVCEFEDKKTTLLGHDVHDTARYLKEQGYSVLVSEWEPIVEYGQRHTWKRFARYPTDVAKEGWGNLIAVDPELLGRVEGQGRAAANRLKIANLLHRS